MLPLAVRNHRAGFVVSGVNWLLEFELEGDVPQHRVLAWATALSAAVNNSGWTVSHPFGSFAPTRRALAAQAATLQPARSEARWFTDAKHAWVAIHQVGGAVDCFKC